MGPSMNKEFILKVAALIVTLFIGYLWSGGVWEYRHKDRFMFKSNKLTGTTYVLYESEWKRIRHGGELK